MRSFEKLDGKKRRKDLVKQLVPYDNNSYKIYPVKNEKVIRIVKKVIRGLCYHHNIISPISENQIVVVITSVYPIPPVFIEEMEYYHQDKEICEYRIQRFSEDNLNSGWLIKFLGKVEFLGIVLEN